MALTSPDPTSHFNPKQPRDAHGRWIKGFASLSKLIDTLPIEKWMKDRTLLAMERHTFKGRGIPEAAEDDHTKALAYLAATLRADASTYRKSGDSKQAKMTDRTARAVESAEAASRGDTRQGSTKPISANEITPKAEGLTGRPITDYGKGQAPTPKDTTTSLPPIAVKVKKKAATPKQGFKLDTSALSPEAQKQVTKVEAALNKVVKLDRTVKVKELPADDPDTARAHGDGSVSVSSTTMAAGNLNPLVHELGHMLDRHVLGEGEWHNAGTSNDEMTGKLYRMLHDTPTMQSIRDGNEPLLKGDDKTKSYMGNGREMFARAFDQYVAEKSGDPSLTGRIDKTLADSMLAFQYWPHDEFKPISDEIDNILSKRGLTHPSTPKVVKKVAPPKVVKKATPKVKVKATGEVKVTKKVTAVSIRADGIKPGDIIDLGQARIQVGTKQKKSKYSYWSHEVPAYKRTKLERRVIAVEPTNESQQVRLHLSEPLNPELRNPDNMAEAISGKHGSGWGSYTSYGNVETGPTEIVKGNKSVVKVKRLIETKKMAGTKVKLSEHPDASSYHEALQEALDNGDDLAPFDPALRPLLQGQAVGHAQQLLYDMAVGKASGKFENRRVVTDGEYRKQLEQSHELASIERQAAKDEPYTFGNVYGFKEPRVTLPGTATDEELARMYTALRGPGMGPQRESFRNAWMALNPGDGNPSIHEFAQSLKPEDYAQAKADLRQPKVQTEYDNQPKYTTDIQQTLFRTRDRQIKQRINSEVTKRINGMRATENTVARDYNLPRWDDAVMQPQTWDSIQSHIDKQAEPIMLQTHIEPSRLASAIYESFNTHIPVQPGTATDENQLRLRVATRLSAASPERIKKMLDDPTAPLDAFSGGDAVQKFLTQPTRLTPEQTQAIKNDIDKAVSDAEGAKRAVSTKDYTPSFYAAGVVDDGVLYHRNVTAAIDIGKLQSALKTALVKSGMSEGNADQNATVFANPGGFMEVEDLSASRDQVNAAQNIDQATKDSLNHILDRVQRRIDKGGSVTTGHVSTGPANNAMRKAMNNAGAIEAPDTKAAGGKGTWTELKSGKMLLIQEGGVPLSGEDQVRTSAAGVGAMPMWNSTNTFDDQAQGIKSAYDSAETLDARLAAIDAYEKAYKGSSTYEYAGKYGQESFDNWASTARAAVNYARALRTEKPGEPIRRIEYVPWQQDEGPTKIARSGRGRLTLEGYTPAEAAAKLRELGVVGNLEPHTPAGAIFRSTRRSGTVTPLHQDYVRGIAPPPDSENLLTHGITSRGDPFKEFSRVATSGGLMAIAERNKRGIRTSTTSQVGDIGSGIDHVVFLALGSGGACGAGSPTRIVLRPDTLMRRDVVLAPRDFGGGKNRFSLYKKYRDKLDAEAGVEVGKTDLWSPLSPGARQRHLNEFNNHSGSSEYNIAGTVSVEDMETVAVSDPAVGVKIKQMLDDLLKQGIVTRIPDVISKSNFDQAVKGIAQPEVKTPLTDKQLVKAVAG